MHLLHYNSVPWRPFLISYFEFFGHIFESVWRNSTKLQISDWWKGAPNTSWLPNLLDHSSASWWPFLFHTLTFSAIYTKPFDGIQRNFTWMIDDRRHVRQMIFENACLQQRHLMAILYFISDILKFVNNFKAVWQNSMKLHTSDQWWEMSTPADFTTCSPLVVPPIGHFFILDF